MADTLHFTTIDTPIGQLRLVSDGDALLRVEFQGQHSSDGVLEDDPVLDRARRQLEEYFAGRRRHFDLPLGADGTAFQQAVWSSLRAIPYGELRSYRDIAETLGKPKAVRAVGAANGRNPLPIVVPCHRVVGSNGKLTGFAGGLDCKRRLLALEGIDVAD
ncbi:MAG: methylated-DNA--[protein]-cysteine S-methyltransferase [Halieaceae bacterium]|jgi:methylated-DNA-[protein]-cysteine S-methyltransferase|nr:methylated-DNA--[protein]-cysteine S-methyltransferase [Halieaceae bacterium]